MTAAADARLLLDVGNTRLKWTVKTVPSPNQASQNPLGPVAAIVHHGEPAAALEEIPADWHGRSFQSIWLANVSGAAHLAALQAQAERRFGRVIQTAVSRASQHGLRSGYRRPEQLGVDRWLSMLAGWTRFGGGFAVAVAGTALTYDVVDASGQHLGGLIAPGLLAMQRATLSTTRFPASSPTPSYTDALGDDSDSCVRQGALHAAAGLIERLGERHLKQPLLLAGGDAALLQHHLNRPALLAPDLVLEGLAIYAMLDGRNSSG